MHSCKMRFLITNPNCFARYLYRAYGVRNLPSGYRLFIFLAIIMGTVSLPAQKHNTCEMAIEVNSSAVVIIDCNGTPEQKCAQYFAKEHNVAWITFTVPKDTLLSFDIIPSNSAHDLDFLLFEDLTGNFCQTLSPVCPVPVRFNLANPPHSEGSGTGLSSAAKNESELSGNHPSYCKSLRVKKGERFYLAVDDVTGGGTFNFYLHLSYPHESVTPTVQGVSTIDARPMKVPPMEHRSKYNLHIMVTDSAGKPLNAMVDIYGLTSNKTVSRNFSDDSFALDPGQNIGIYCNAAGYLFSRTSFMEPDDAAADTITIRLVPIRKNENLALSGILFETQKADLLPASNAPLANIVSFMNQNPMVKIMIKGYVNDPYGNNTRRAKSLSEKRAKAVYNYLLKQGIEGKRIKYEGGGSESMIYPHPVNAQQEEANRRVEITIE